MKITCYIFVILPLLAGPAFAQVDGNMGAWTVSEFKDQAEIDISGASRAATAYSCGLESADWFHAVAEITHDDLLRDLTHLTRGVGGDSASQPYDDAVREFDAALYPSRHPTAADCQDERENGAAAGNWDDDVQQYETDPSQYAPD